MSLVKIMVVIAVFNILAITGVIYAIKPKPRAADAFSVQQVEIQKPDTKLPDYTEGSPESLQIPEINLSTDIQDGVYKPETQEWTLSSDSAHHALITPKPNNQSGNTFIYGHNKPEVFGPMVDLQVGTKASITTKEGSVFHYILRSVKDVEPNDTSLFEYKGPAILTVQTCSGAWFEQRRLFTFELIEVTA